MHGLGLGCLVSRRSRDIPTSRLGLGAERLGLGLGLGLEGLVHIPLTIHTCDIYSTCCDGNVSSKSFKTEYVDNLCTFQTRIRHIVIKTFFQRRSSSTHLEGILNTVAHVFDTLWYNRTSNVAIMHAQGW